MTEDQAVDELMELYPGSKREHLKFALDALTSMVFYGGDVEKKPIPGQQMPVNFISNEGAKNIIHRLLFHGFKFESCNVMKVL